MIGRGGWIAKRKTERERGMESVQSRAASRGPYSSCCSCCLPLYKTYPKLNSYANLIEKPWVDMEKVFRQRVGTPAERESGRKSEWE